MRDKLIPKNSCQIYFYIVNKIYHVREFTNQDTRNDLRERVILKKQKIDKEVLCIVECSKINGKNVPYYHKKNTAKRSHTITFDLSPCEDIENAKADLLTQL